MKTYIKPCIDEIVVDTINPIATSGIGYGNEPSDGTQGAPGRKGRVYVEDDYYEDEDIGEDFGW